MQLYTIHFDFIGEPIIILMPNYKKIDKITILGAKNGELTAFEEIVKIYEQQIYSFVFRMVGNKSDAEDLTQEAFLRLYLHIDEYNPDKNFEAWLYTITRRIVYDWLRKKKSSRETFVLDDPNSNSSKVLSQDGSEKNIKRTEEDISKIIDIENALSHLSPNYREVLLLFYWEGYSYAEISEIIDVPLNTVKTLIRRAKVSIKDIYYRGGETKNLPHS